MKKAETVSSPDQAHCNNINKNNIFTQARCFYCAMTPCLHHVLEGEGLAVALCFQHSLELMQKGAAAFFEQLKKDAGIKGGAE